VGNACISNARRYKSMNYIPGFSNYLETSVPQYGGDPIMDDPRQAAVMPMTQEAVGPLSYEALADRRAAANTPPPGTSIVGPYAGKKGLSFGDDNTFDIYDEQEVRVVDGKGNVIFTGTGVEGAKRAVAVGQSLSNDLGKNANFKIQKAERTISNGSVGPNRYIDVAYAAPSQSGLGFLADNVLPFAASFIPGIGPIAGAALGSAVSSGLQGRSLQDALVRAAIAGGSAYAGGQVFGPASSSAGSTAGSVAGSTAGSAAGSVTDDVINVIGRNLVGSTLGSTIGTGLSSVTGYKTPAEKYTQQTSTTLQPPAIDYAGVEPIDVLATRLASGSGSPFAAAFPIPVSAMLAGTLNSTQPTQQNKTAEDLEAEKNPMVVTGAELETLTPDELLAALGGVGGLAAATAGNVGSTATNQAKTAEDLEAAKNPITVTGGGLESLTPDELLAALGGVGGLAAVTAGGGAPTDPAAEKAKADADAKKKLGVEDYLSLGSKAVGFLGNLGGGGGGGSGQTGTYMPGGGRLGSVFSAKLPSAGGLGRNRTARSLGDVDYLTYGTRPELSFFDYAPATSAPITSPIPNNPAAPAMYAPDVDNVRFAKGGRTEFAVNGAGTGRSDDIPAVLSDGEYVIDAETVALLGDGSNKAGAKKLDELRIKVRKHKGRKLAKGRFSANAKRPEAYLSGGRI
jgi:hypothetical protein